MARFSVSMNDDLKDRLDALHGGEEAPYENRSNAVTHLCEDGLAYREHFADTDPAELADRLRELEQEVDTLEAERDRALEIARYAADRERGVVGRIADAIRGRHPFEEVPALEPPDGVERVEAERVDDP